MCQFICLFAPSAVRAKGSAACAAHVCCIDSEHTPRKKHLEQPRRNIHPQHIRAPRAASSRHRSKQNHSDVNTKAINQQTHKHQTNKHTNTQPRKPGHSATQNSLQGGFQLISKMPGDTTSEIHSAVNIVITRTEQRKRSINFYPPSKVESK